MKKKIIAFSFLVCVIAAFSGPSPAQAYVFISGLKDTEVVTDIVVTGRTRDGLWQDCLPFEFFHEQFVVLFVLDEDGTERVVPEWAFVDYVSQAGPTEITFAQTLACPDGSLLQKYGLGICSC